MIFISRFYFLLEYISGVESVLSHRYSCCHSNTGLECLAHRMKYGHNAEFQANEQKQKQNEVNTVFAAVSQSFIFFFPSPLQPSTRPHSNPSVNFAYKPKSATSHSNIIHISLKPVCTYMRVCVCVRARVSMHSHRV